MTAADLLAELRAVPAVGSWAVLNSVWTAVDGWHWDGCRPTEWFHLRADAVNAARARTEPTWIGQVIAVAGGWSIGDVHDVAWTTAAGIAADFDNVTPDRVLATASLLGLSAASKHVSKSVGEALYDSQATALIERELRSRGHRKRTP